MRIFIKKIFNLIIDLIFPPNKEELEIRKLSPQSFKEKVKRAKKPEFYFINAVIAYKDRLAKELIWQIKYKKNKYAIEIAGFILYQWINENIKDDCILIPIPISKRRRKERGYNQCELIIDEIIRLNEKDEIKKIKLEKNYNLLIREKNLSKQTFKNKKERLKANDIFKINKESSNNDFLKDNFLNKKIIIIDDVTTTGNTLKEAYSVMLKTQYRNIIVIALAH